MFRLQHEGSMIELQCQLVICRGSFYLPKGTFENFCDLRFCRKSRYCDFFSIGLLFVSWLGGEVKNDMSDQYNDSLGVCNVKIR